ncbi:hypothetical protein [Streptomyces sp. NPDC001135]
MPRITTWEAAAEQDEPYSYYGLWLAALEDVLTSVRAVSTDEVITRARSLAQRPPGHDH